MQELLQGVPRKMIYSKAKRLQIDTKHKTPKFIVAAERTLKSRIKRRRAEVDMMI